MELRIENLSKRYANGVQALDDVSLTVPPGMFGLLGPNGAGKSTFMRILATLQEPDQGTVQLGDINVLEDKESLRRVLGYLPQEFGLYPKLTAIRLLDHFAVLKGITDKKQRAARVDSLLEQTNLGEARNRQLGGFSGGMKQRFGIAVALLAEPKLIIVDEPTAGLDPTERVRFLNLLAELGEKSVVILSTHIVDDVSELCSRMAIINEGKILLETEPLKAQAELSGRLWRKLVAKDELAGYQERFRVLSSRLVSGRTQVRVLAESRPDESFDIVEPNLEDVYFGALHGLAVSSASALT